MAAVDQSRVIASIHCVVLMLRAVGSNVLSRGRSLQTRANDVPPKARKSLQLLYQTAVPQIEHAV
jgi:hypothetical protein